MEREKASRQLFWCLFTVYTINILGKMSFAAATVGLIDYGILTKTQAGLISGMFWFLYAIGQFAGGVVVSKINPYTLINIAVVSSLLANFVLAGTNNFFIILFVWSINGMAQFGLWPAILKLVSTELIPKQRVRAFDILAFCFCLGSIISYFLASIVFAIASWEYVFVSCGVLIGISWIVIIYARRRLSPQLRTSENSVSTTDGKTTKLSWTVAKQGGLIFFGILIVIKSIMDNGIKNWMPTIMLETYDASPSFTSMLSVILLIINIFGVVVTTYIYHKVNYDELVTLRILYVTMIPMMLFLLNFRNMHILLVTILMSAITLLVYGSGQIMAMHYPGRFQHLGLTPTVGAFINGFAALGNVLASYGSGFIADHFGWDVMIGVWNALLIFFVALTIIMIPMWNKFRKRA